MNELTNPKDECSLTQKVDDSLMQGRLLRRPAAPSWQLDTSP
jgi:hypothetical protein